MFSVIPTERNLRKTRTHCHAKCGARFQFYNNQIRVYYKVLPIKVWSDVCHVLCGLFHFYVLSTNCRCGSRTKISIYLPCSLSLSLRFPLYMRHMLCLLRTLNLKSSPMTSGWKADVIKERNVTISAQFKSKQFAKLLSHSDCSQVSQIVVVVLGFWLKW